MNLYITAVSYFRVAKGDNTEYCAGAGDYTIPSSGDSETKTLEKRSDGCFVLTPGYYKLTLVDKYNKLEVVREHPYLYGQINGGNWSGNANSFDKNNYLGLQVTGTTRFRIFLNGKHYGPYEGDGFYTFPSNLTRQEYEMKETKNGVEGSCFEINTNGMYKLYLQGTKLIVEKEGGSTQTTPYIYGSFNGANWDNNMKDKFDNNVKTLTITKQSRFRVNINGKNYGPNVSKDVKGYEVPKTGDYEECDMVEATGDLSDNYFQLGRGKYTLTLDGTKLKVKKETIDFVVGHFDGSDAGWNWTATTSPYPLDFGSTTVVVNSVAYFKVKDINGTYYGAQSANAGGGTENYLIPESGNSQHYDLFQGTDKQQCLAFKLNPGKYTFSLAENGDRLRLTVTKEEDPYYYLIGDINGSKDWNAKTSSYVLKKEGDVYKAIFAFSSKSYFRVSNGEGKTYGPNGSDDEIKDLPYEVTTTENSNKAYVVAPADNQTLTYIVTYNPETKTLKVENVVAANKKYVYYDAMAWGAYNTTDGKVKADFFSTRGGVNDYLISVEMERVVEQIYRAEIPDKAVEVKFHFKNKADNVEIYQLASAAEGFDDKNWDKFIYTPGNGKAAQSYVTFEDYMAAYNAKKEKIYVVGQNYQNAAGVEMIADTENAWTIKDPTVYTAESDVFYIKYTKLDESKFENINNNTSYTAEEKLSLKQTRFKVSWMDVKGIFDKQKEDGTTFNDNRGWATFNLGIIGPDPKDESMKANLNAEYYFYVNETGRFNNFTQFDWKPQLPTDDVASEDNMRYVVIDLHPTCQSFSLLPFSPNPKAKVNYTDVEKIYMKGNCTQFDGDMLENEGATSGEVYFPYVNKLSGNVEMKVDAKAEQYAAGVFDMKYLVYIDGKLIGTTEGAGTAVNVDYLPIDASLNARAQIEFKYLSNGLTFHSRYEDQKVTQELFTLETPTLSPTTNSTLLMTGNLPDEDGLGTYDAALECTFEVPPTYINKDTNSEPLAVYADFNVNELTTPGETPADKYAIITPDILTTDFVTTSQDEENVYASLMQKLALTHVHTDGSDYEPGEDEHEFTYEPFISDAKNDADTQYNHEVNNWSRIIAKTDANLPVYVPEVTPIETDNNGNYKNVEVEFRVDGYAVYPFLVRKEMNVELSNTTNAPRRVMAKEGTNSDPNVNVVVGPNVTPVENNFDASDYEVRLVTVGTIAKTDDKEAIEAAKSSAYFAFTNKDVTTGIRTISSENVDDANAPAEYYNLQGVRVANPASGTIVICRKGNKVTKLMVK